MRKTAFGVIKAPVNTEKARLGWVENPKGREYTFLVDITATGAEVKAAVEKAFGVKVASVRTVIRRGKVRRRRLHPGPTPDTKRAMVRLMPEQKIAFFDGI